MKKILLFLFCFFLCGCEVNIKTREEILHCTLYTNSDYSYLYSTEIKDFYFNKDDIVNKICYDDTLVYDTIEQAIDGFKLYGYIYNNNAKLEGTIIRVNYCTEEINENGKRNLDETKKIWENFGYECTIKDAN